MLDSVDVVEIFVYCCCYFCVYSYGFVFFDEMWCLVVVFEQCCQFFVVDMCQQGWIVDFVVVEMEDGQYCIVMCWVEEFIVMLIGCQWICFSFIIVDCNCNDQVWVVVGGVEGM